MHSLAKIKSKIVTYKHLAVAVVLMSILIHIFVLKPVNDLIILFLTGLGILVIWLYEFEGRISISGGLIFLALCPFLLVIKQELMAEKVAIWAFMFLVVGTFQVFIEYLEEEKKDGKRKK